MHLSDKALLVNLSTSQWMGRKQDKKAANTIADMQSADRRSYSATKYLLPNSDDLKAIHSHTAEVRKQFYNNTLPWGIEATFILPTGNYIEFMRYFREQKEAHERLVETFCAGFTEGIEQAKQVMGSAFNANEYPHPDQIRGKFKMDLNVMPVPTAGDFRVEMIDEELQLVTADIERKVLNAQQKAMQDVWDRLHEHVAWFVDRLSDPKNVFKDSGFEKAKSTVELLKRLNFADDPHLEQLRKDVEDKLTSYHPDTLRFDPEVRQQAADDAADIMAKMGAFMGGVKV